MTIFNLIIIVGILISFIIPSWINTPKDLSIWLEKDFTYQAEEENKDYWKTPKETIKDKGGDCEDLAFLAQYVLKKLGYETKLIIIVLQINDNDRTGHAICVFKNKKGKWEHFSNTQYINLGFDTIRQLLNFNYNQWVSYYECDIEKNCTLPRVRLE